MTKQRILSGFSANDLPYMTIGEGPKKLVVFEGLNFTHKPPSGIGLRMVLRIYRALLIPDYTVHIVGRRPGLPEGTTMRDMANDYAVMVRDEIGPPVDIAGISTGGPPALWFASDHTELVRKLVLISTGYRLSDHGKKAQLEVLKAARTGDKRATAVATAALISKGFLGILMKLLLWTIAPIMYEKGDSLSDGIAELDAEDKFDFKDRLASIKVPTLVIGGAEDRLYLIRETAAGIPDAKLILYERTGHSAMMKKVFKGDLKKFLEG